MQKRLRFEDYIKTYNCNKSLQFYPIILRLKRKGFPLRAIEQLYSSVIPKSTLYFWYNQKRIPAQFRSFSNAKKRVSSEEIELLAPLIGSIFGDGGITNEGYVHYCNTEPFLILRFRKIIESVFAGELPCLSEDKGAMHLVYSPRIGRALWCIFGKFSFGADTKIITGQIRAMPLDWRIKMVSALYDDDGSAVKLKHCGYVAFKQKLKNIAVFVQNVVSECGIRSALSPDGDKWHLRIYSYRDMLKFKHTINFAEGYRKRETLDRILGSIHAPHFVTKEIILNLLKDGPKTYNEIAKSFSLNPKTIRGHMHGWNKDSQKESLIKLGLVNAVKSGRKVTYSLAQ
ncbi:MAG TPA: hypothetical protein HA362_00950 [Nanoarchaeota archaeon]|nr:hypothetical protein [Nanoarchaeota archaeon]